MGSAGSCSETTNSCGSPYYCPLNPGEKAECLACNANQPVGTSCQCGKKFTIKPNCAECNEENCVLCTRNYFLKKGVCESCIANCVRCTDLDTCTECFFGYFVNADRQCEKCDQNCQSCTDSTVCLSCLSDQFLTAEKTCVNCSRNCDRCANLATCTTCKTGNFNSDEGCFACNENMLIGSICQCQENQITNCANCDKNTCRTCRKFYKLIGGTCQPDHCQGDNDCLSGTFCDVSDTKINQCKDCDKNCKQCSVQMNLCTTCQEGQFLDQNTCKVCEIESISGFSCNCGSQLIQYCGKCANDVCVSCGNGYYLVENTCNRCSEDQKIGESCVCDSKLITNCIECDITSCKTCKSQFKLIDLICVPDQCQNSSECQADEFCYISSTETNKCQKCSENCAICTDITTCTVCENGFSNQNNMCVPCEATLPIGSTCQCGAQKTLNCAACDAGSCSLCITNYRLSNGACIIDMCQPGSCKTGEFCETNDITGNSCQICDENCETCDITSKNCKSCKQNNFLSNAVCAPCDSKPGIEFSCTCATALIQNCVNCDSGACTACADGHFLAQNRCLSCSENAEIGSSCTCEGKNFANCSECGPSSCGKCVPGTKLLEGNCVIDECGEKIFCQSGAFCEQNLSSANACVACPQNCAQCSSGSACEACENDHFLTEKTCAPCSGIQSEKCNCGGILAEGCARCDGAACAECAEGSLLLEGACVNCAENPRMCQNTLALVGIGLGAVLGLALAVAAVILVIWAVKKRKARANKDYDTDVVGVRISSSSSQLF
ncbi:Cysteine-rich membrane protein 2 [Spironucleus salmonicida]|uniref:Cysteine-rich membrane protein 2 n=1 Tax=Spironucleus salmonicida TaxID=348837 RepID=V6LTX1_9EUKA|nr:Cysteine-rich membrane protein 2 [Spironucleus salmonicida]|eukprot:EST44224.1 Cysteine-rich membrane protein 2 [Spironucleus salmonicida]